MFSNIPSFPKKMTFELPVRDNITFHYDKNMPKMHILKGEIRPRRKNADGLDVTLKSSDGVSLKGLVSRKSLDEWQGLIGDIDEDIAHYVKISGFIKI